MITNPKLKPRPGMVEVEYQGKRMYRDIKTGALVEPGAQWDEEKAEQEEFMRRFRKTDEYALLEYVLMMEGIL